MTPLHHVIHLRSFLALLAIAALYLAPSHATAGEDVPCAESEACQNEGRCVTLPFGDCGTEEEACRSSYLCLHDGRCTFDPVTDDCIASSTRHCQGSAHCWDTGRCEWDRETGRCVVGEAGCRASPDCQSLGRCTLIGDACAVGSNADCEDSALCEQQGACSFVGARCVATAAEHCRDADICRRHGQCTLVDREGAAVAHLEAGGRCHHAGRCESQEACSTFGACSPGADGRCVPANENHCRDATACSDRGLCTFLPAPPPPDPNAGFGMSELISVRGPVCIVAGPEDCEQACEGVPGCRFQEGIMGANTCESFGALESLFAPMEGHGLHAPGHLLEGIGGDGLGFGTMRGGPTVGEGSGGGIGTLGGFDLRRASEPVDDAEEEDPGAD